MSLVLHLLMTQVQVVLITVLAAHQITVQVVVETLAILVVQIQVTLVDHLTTDLTR